MCRSGTGTRLVQVQSAMLRWSNSRDIPQSAGFIAGHRFIHGVSNAKIPREKWYDLNVLLRTHTYTYTYQYTRDADPLLQKENIFTAFFIDNGSFSSIKEEESQKISCA